MIIFKSINEALASLDRCEKTECRVSYGAEYVYVQTPEGFGKFLISQWPIRSSEMIANNIKPKHNMRLVQ